MPPIPAPTSHATSAPSASSTTEARELTQRGQRRRSELMDAAVSIFAAKGFQGTSVAEIVREIGVGKGVFYWYFDSKQALFGEILRETLIELRHSQADAIADIDDPVDRIALGIQASLRYFAKNRRLFAVLEQAWTIDTFRARLREGQEVVVGDTARHVQDGIERGRVRDADPRFLAHAIFGVTTHVARTFVTGDADVEALINESINFCLEGLLKANR